MRRTYEIRDLMPYINWGYYYHAWQLHTPDQQRQSKEEAEQMLSQLDGKYHAYALFQLFDAHSEGDDIVVSMDGSTGRIPLLRQQTVGSNCLCLSDFIHPQYDQIGVFATTVDHGLEADFNHDVYQKIMVQLLADRLAEAAAEKLHEQVRREDWGYTPDERLAMDDLHAERFQGIRPAVGYPSLPDTSLNFVLDQLLPFSQIGIRLTENGAMRPHASVSGLMIALPDANYFTVGKIGDDQLHDYARRRGLPVEMLRKFLAPNL